MGASIEGAETLTFKKVDMPDGISRWVPSELDLRLPTDSDLPVADQHFLTYIPWDDKYLELVPKDWLMWRLRPVSA